MKTTIHIADALLVRSKEVAAAEGITLRELVEDALRRALEARDTRPSFVLPDRSVGGEGLQAGQAWELPRELAYDEST